MFSKLQGPEQYILQNKSQGVVIMTWAAKSLYKGNLWDAFGISRKQLAQSNEHYILQTTGPGIVRMAGAAAAQH